MQQSAISLAVTACLSLTMAQAAQANEATQSQQVSQDVERITVYGKQNKVVMNSGLATKSDMSLMETPAALVVIDKELFAAQGPTLCRIWCVTSVVLPKPATTTA